MKTISTALEWAPIECAFTDKKCLKLALLYLVPGVPLINGVIDVVEGYVLTGFARLTEASLLIVSIAIGLSFTLLMVKNSLI